MKHIEDSIKAALPDAHVQILDPRNDGIHLEAHVVSKKFEGLPLFKQHQIVMKALKPQFDTGLHAMGLKTYTPEAWDERRSNNI